MSLTALTDRVHSDQAIPPGRKCFLLMLFEDGCHPLHQMHQYTEIDGMKIIGSDNSCQREAFQIPDDTF